MTETERRLHNVETADLEDAVRQLAADDCEQIRRRMMELPEAAGDFREMVEDAYLSEVYRRLGFDGRGAYKGALDLSWFPLEKGGLLTIKKHG